jgi:phenylacetate-CoA ligase
MASLHLWAAARLKRLAFGELIRRHPVHYPRALRHFADLAAQPLAERKRRTLARLTEVLHAAARTRHGLTVTAPRDLDAWPCIDKPTVRADPDAWLTPGSWVAAHAQTSGTTGIPLRLVRSSESLAYEQAAIDGLMRQLQVDPGSARVAVLRGESVPVASGRWWAVAHGGRRLTLSSYHLTRETIGAYASTLRAFRPDVLCAYPSTVEALCHLLTETRETLYVPRVLCSSEVLCPSTWDLARAVLGCELADYYGQAERVAFASATAPSEYRFLPGYAHIELRRLAADGDEVTYEIIGTPLWNLAMPLVRYRTGDLLRLPASFGARELEEIAYGTRSFGGVAGRNADVLLLPDGARLTAINHIPRDVTRIVGLQLVQDTLTHVRIRVLPGPRYDAADGEAFLLRARSALPVTMTVSIEPTEALERGKLGKIPTIVHGPAVREALVASGVRRQTSGDA